MAMNHPDFVALAEVLKDLHNHSNFGSVKFETVYERLTEFCSKRNPNFNSLKFYQAVYGEELQPMRKESVSKYLIKRKEI